MGECFAFTVAFTGKIGAGCICAPNKKQSQAVDCLSNKNFIGFNVEDGPANSTLIYTFIGVSTQLHEMRDDICSSPTLLRVYSSLCQAGPTEKEHAWGS